MTFLQRLKPQRREAPLPPLRSQGSVGASNVESTPVSQGVFIPPPPERRRSLPHSFQQLPGYNRPADTIKTPKVDSSNTHLNFQIPRASTVFRVWFYNFLFLFSCI